MPYSYNRYLGIFYMHYHIAMLTHTTAFGEPVGGTDESKLVNEDSKWIVKAELIIDRHVLALSHFLQDLWVLRIVIFFLYTNWMDSAWQRIINIY